MPPRRARQPKAEESPELPLPLQQMQAHLRPILAQELLRPYRKRMSTRQARSSAVDEIWTADLMDLASTGFTEAERGGYNFLLCVLDVHSRFAWGLPLERKTGTEVTDGFRALFASDNVAAHPPTKLWVDQGTEFINAKMKQLLKDHNCEVYHTFSEHGAAIAERFIRTLRGRLAKLALATGRTDVISMLNQCIHEYNDSVHSAIGATPREVYEGEFLLHDGDHERKKKPAGKEEEMLPVGTMVRLSTIAGQFEKRSQRTNWSYEVYRITKAVPPKDGDPAWYEVADESGEPVIGCFYRDMLQPTRQTWDQFLVDHVIKRETLPNGQVRILVQKFGIPPTEPHAQAWVRLP